MTDTVKFNVGGKHFEVSRALISANSETMLAKMISETWEQEPEKPLFIDRDGDMFAHVLNYLRYGSIELPISTTRAMFQRELDYYAISAANGTVTDVKKKTLAEITSEMAQQELQHKIFALALECYNRYQAAQNATTLICASNAINFYLDKDKNRELYECFGKTRDLANIKGTLDEYLQDYFGLCVEIRPSNTFSVSMKK
eukprot:scaffold148390_cov36-Cyclotella_meneghiniana.AAC.1